jgi:peptide/nickel transport system substrate-binding protein
MLPAQAFGYDPALAPYAFAPDKTRALLSEAGHPDGLSLTLIAPEALRVQATVVSKMLEQGGFQVDLQVLDPATHGQKTSLSHLEQPPEQQTWDIALTSSIADVVNFPMYTIYHNFAIDGQYDWVLEQPELHQRYTQVLGTVDREQQQALSHQMEQHTRDQAYFLFLYNPIKLYAVNKAVEFVPYISTMLALDATGVLTEHWSVRKKKAGTRE